MNEPDDRTDKAISVGVFYFLYTNYEIQILEANGTFLCLYRQ